MDTIMDTIVPGVGLKRFSEHNLEVSFSPSHNMNATQWGEALLDIASVEIVVARNAGVHPSLFHQPEHENEGKFMKALVSLPKLKSWYWFGNVSVALASFVLRHAVGLDDFCAGLGPWVGTELEFRELSRGFEDHKALTTLSLDGCIFPADLSVHSRSLMSDCARMTRLKSIALSGLSAWGLDSSDFARVFLNPRLKSVSLGGMVLNQNFASEIVNRLSRRDPSNILHELTLEDFGGLATIESSAIASLLDEIWEPFLGLLESNVTLSEICVEHVLTVPDNDHDELGKLDSNPKVEFLLKLNRLGRGKVQGQSATMSKEEWIQQLAACGNDLDCLFYFLSLDPSLCNTTYDQQRKTKKRKRSDTVTK
ncbi:expressed unknown protein [Seminavis robusta]|uniref:Uncharacterized protein n=1 Tax=Seminavis robusta TaxID=568900 RepID=A0A9N8HKJ1_9STRA|nr:expressed unknown protein [Seminavis robusta]|eukprot:Sro619_g176480.1 n/a (367) ;mRNA; f:39805-41051